MGQPKTEHDNRFVACTKLTTSHEIWRLICWTLRVSYQKTALFCVFVCIRLCLLKSYIYIYKYCLMCPHCGVQVQQWIVCHKRRKVKYKSLMIRFVLPETCHQTAWGGENTFLLSLWWCFLCGKGRGIIMVLDSVNDGALRTTDGLF